MKLSRPSPALIVSIVALVVACAGTATAASLLITNSSQVKTSALNGSDIKNASLTGIDLKDGSVKGVKLGDGQVTSKQIKNDSVAADDLAPAVRNTLKGEGLTAQEVVRRAGPDAQPAGQARVATLAQLPAGTYFITAKTTITADASELGIGELLRQNKTAGAECILEVGGDQDHARQAVVTPGSVAPSTLNVQMTRTIDTPTDVLLNCNVNDYTWRATDTSIVALKLNGSTRVDTTS